jgi:ATP-dependent HslUV protease ATP-binding subunit HslU
MNDMTPRQIVQALDRFIVGQDDAKRAVAIAIRNRWRRLHLPRELREDVAPRNILMIGPTGVGKTEIARRMAQLIRAPFLKVEATKFTEVGYHGRDVDSILRDLVERALVVERARLAEAVHERARESAEERILDQLLPGDSDSDEGDVEERRRRTREKLRVQLRGGQFADRMVEVSVDERPLSPHVVNVMGLDQMGPDIERMFERLMPTRSRRQRLPVADALEMMTQQEIDRLIDQDALHEAAIRSAEQTGIVFLDELDKLCIGGGGDYGGPDVSRFGVQRDLLPMVEGTTVSTRYGLVRSDHVLFIAAGAFTQSKPSDLMPELQGRFPIRVTLKDLGPEDYLRILTEPSNSMISQQIALMATEGVKLSFTDGAIQEMAETAHRTNQTIENIGARRLYTVVEKVVEDIAFNASDAVNKEVTIDVDYVRIHLADIISDEERSAWEL